MPSSAVKDYLAKIGKKGGQAKVPKGFAALSDEERKRNAQKAAETRWGKGKKKTAKRKAA